MFKTISYLTAVGVILTLVGCKTEEDFRKERVQKAMNDFEKIKKRTVTPGTKFTIDQCIEIALKQNLDLEVYKLKQAVSEEQRTAQMLGMLPDLYITDDATSRSGEPGSSSQSIKTGKQSLEASKSSEKTENHFKVELALSTLDFGLAFFNSMQAEDRVLLTKQQERRAAQNLTLDVVRAYYRVAAAQDAIHTTQALIDKCHSIENVFAELSKSQTVSPLRLLDERKRFIRLEKRLMAYRRSYNNACIELRALMGYLPINDIRVDTSGLKALQVYTLPPIEVLEKISLVERPELYQLDIQAEITLFEARKAIIMMFPSVRIFADFTNSSNKFLYTQSWWEIGIRAAYNLLKLPEQIAKYRSLHKEIDEISLRTMALSLGILSQVRIAHANVMEVKERYELDNRVYQAYASHLKIAKQNYKAGRALSKLELDRMELETAETQIDRMLALSNYYLAYYRLKNSVGVHSLDNVAVDKILKQIKATEMAMSEKTAKKKSQELASVSGEIKKNSDTLNGIVLGENTLSNTEKSKIDKVIAPAVQDAMKKNK